MSSTSTRRYDLRLRPEADRGYTGARYLRLIADGDTAHIARENGIWDGQTLTDDNLANYRLRPEAAEATAVDAGGHLAQAATPPAPTPPSVVARIGRFELILLGLGALAAFLAIGGLLLWRNRAR